MFLWLDWEGPWEVLAVRTSPISAEPRGGRRVLSLFPGLCPELQINYIT